jgi:hypothetical protein
MAGVGRAPSETRSRKRDADRREKEMTAVEDTGELHGPALPEGVLPDDEPWHPQTLALWDSLRRSPLLANEPSLGWQFLIDTALMHHTMWTKGRWEFASEVRLRVAKFGATPEDRMRLKVKVEPPKKVSAEPLQESAEVTDIRSRRSRLTG